MSAANAVSRRPRSKLPNERARFAIKHNAQDLSHSLLVLSRFQRRKARSDASRRWPWPRTKSKRELLVYNATHVSVVFTANSDSLRAERVINFVTISSPIQIELQLQCSFTSSPFLALYVSFKVISSLFSARQGVAARSGPKNSTLSCCSERLVFPLFSFTTSSRLVVAVDALRGTLVGRK